MSDKAKHHFFVSPDNILGGIIIITQPEYHHAVSVLRCKAGDFISVFDGSGNKYTGSIVSVDKNAHELKVKIENMILDENEKRELILIQSLIKGPRMDFIIEKATEVGVTRICPVITDFSVVKLDEKQQKAKIEKWMRIVKETAKQCKRPRLPVIEKIRGFADAVKALNRPESKIICTLRDERKDLYSLDESNVRSIAVAIGPEGDFSADEVKIAVSHGFIPVCLGHNILRAETAAVVALGVLSYKYKHWLKTG